MIRRKNRKALLVVNPRARRGAESIDAVKEVLDAGGISFEEASTKDQENISELISRRARNVDLAIIGGGDGTLNAAAAGLVYTRLPLGLLPLGTANDFARTLGIPPDPVEAAKIIAFGQPRLIDLGEVNGHLFFNVASVGISCDLARELDPEVKRRFGRLGYAIAGIRVFGRAKPFRATIKTPNKTVGTRTLQIAVGNGRYYGGGNVIEEGAEIDDATLRLYSLEFAKAWKIILSFHHFRKGTHGNLEEVLTLHSDRIEILTSRPRPVNADGEIITQKPAAFGVLRKGIQVFGPRTE